MRNKVSLFVGAVLLLGVSLVRAENWSNWRGPNFDGSSSEGNLPTEFSPEKNVRWSAEMQGPAAATPIVWGDSVFISTVHDRARRLLAVCYDRETGEKRWERTVAVGIKKDDRSNYASSSPVTDGERVYFFYGNGDLVAYDFDGEEQWSRNIQEDYGEFAFLWTFSSSPVLHDGTLYLQVLQRDEPVGGRGREDGPNHSYLLALDSKTGKEQWRHIRPSNAKQESREAFTTPMPYTHEGQSQLLVSGGDAISGHSFETGEELWRWGTWNPRRIGHWRLVASPVAGNGVALACAPKGSPVYAVPVDREGDISESGLLWKSEGREVSSDVSTPLFYQGRFYVLNSDDHVISCVEPKTGKVLWSGELNSRAKLESSPTGADGKIYCMNHRGKVFVLEAGDDFNVLHSVDMGTPDDERIRSSIAVSQGDLFIRTDSKLYCVSLNEQLARRE